ncbi:MAG: glycosyltransferase family 8 protein, partial [Lachnospiraceae bacterium]|nr:glycosyltransferase family 8 protein [Lachnospiraceae bacterium]
MKILNVLYQTDDNYAAIAGVSMTSLFRTNSHMDEIHIYLLDSGISEENLQKFSSLCSEYGRDLEVIDTAPLTEKIKSYGVGTFRNVYTVYLTMFVMNDLKLKGNRIFKLDADTIVEGPLDELLELDMKGSYLAATYDCTLNSYKEMVGLTPDDRYFNAGIILFDQEAWINNRCQDQLVDHIHKCRTRYYLCEQDLMNVVFQGRIAYLPVKYNLNSGFYIFGAETSFKLYQLNPYAFSSPEEVKEAMEHPVVHHLMGAMTGRPWEVKNTHPLKKEFQEILASSLWAGWTPNPVKRPAVFKMQKFLRSILQDWAYIRIHRYMNRRFLK